MTCRPFGLYMSSSALPPRGFLRRYTKIYFGENQLLPDSISFSLLTSGHPRVLNNSPVRSSIPISRNFNLPKASSSGFGSIPHCINCRPIKTRFRCAFAPAALRRAIHNKSLAHSSIGTLSPAPADCSASFEVQFLVDKWFQVLFQRPHRPAFHLSLTVLVHYRSRKVFSLT